MNTIHVRNVHQALPEGLRHLSVAGLRETSRAGEVLVSPTPVMTVYDRPTERVLFWEDRDANPFFHLMEALWMLAGRNDVEWLSQFNYRMKEYSDDGLTFHGAYGHRWRRHFTIDQLEVAVRLLQNHPTTRRAVIQMWDCEEDLHISESEYKDIPCNDMIFLWINPEGSRLDMTVLCRSNDIIWGAYGANAVHFSILQEYLAARLSKPVGKLYQFSNNYHAYLEVFKKVEWLEREAADPYRAGLVKCPYTKQLVATEPLVTPAALSVFDEELHYFMGVDFDGEPPNYKNSFLRHAAIVGRAYRVWKKDHSVDAAQQLIAANTPSRWDFGVACIEWLGRRRK